MANSESIMGRAILLIIVIMSIGYLYSCSNSDILEFDEEIKIQEAQKKEKTSYIELKATKEVPSERVVVSDKYVGKLNAGDAVIVKNKDGSAYIVTKGTVLVDDMLITANEEESTVYKIKEPIKSVSSN